MEMRAGMTLHHMPAGTAMVRILMRTERADLLKQKLLFFIRVIALHGLRHILHGRRACNCTKKD